MAFVFSGMMGVAYFRFHAPAVYPVVSGGDLAIL
jgi:hypothetical protein